MPSTPDSRPTRQAQTRTPQVRPMSSLVRLAGKGKWEQCHAMLDRGEGDVNKRDLVRSALVPRTRHGVTFQPFQPWRLRCKPCLRART
jgi:hypothetical protein